MSAPRSIMMDKLYGLADSKKTYAFIEFLDPTLNEEIQRIAYDHYWSLPGLSIRDKALVTLTSLITTRKEEQTKIHITGLLNTGGTNEIIINMLLYLLKFVGIDSVKKGLNAFVSILLERNESKEIINKIQNHFEKITKNSLSDIQFDLSKRDESIINISMCVAIGDQKKTEESVKQFFAERTCNKDDLKHILIHQIVYCGFPSAAYGFRAIKTVMGEKN